MAYALTKFFEKKKNQEAAGLVAGIAIGVLVVGGAYYLYTRKKQPTVYEPGDSARALQGQQIIVRLPRGKYSMNGDDGLVKIMAQRSKGENTDVVLQLMTDITSYTLNLLFVDEADTSETYELELNGLTKEEF